MCGVGPSMQNASMTVQTTYEIRPVRAEEWRQVKDLRMHALQDDAAPIAFLTTLAEAEARDDASWRTQTANGSLDAGNEAGSRQFVAIADDGIWVGMTILLIERAGTEDFAGSTIERDGGYVIGVYVHPDHRGAGLVDRLFDAALAWAREIGLDRARLHVHTDNARARAVYRRLGFAETGSGFTGPIGEELEMARAL